MTEPDDNPLENVPFVAFSNDELRQKPDVKAGDRIVCPHCQQTHVLKDSDPPMLLFYSCREHTYLAGVRGKLVGPAERTDA